jgi:hypothetical protein
MVMDMKEIQKIVLNLKDGETRTKQQLLKEMEPFLDKELEKLRKAGEIYSPKENVFTRIG